MESIVCNGIGKIYGKKQVLKDINLTLEKGKIYGLIGRNGAGTGGMGSTGRRPGRGKKD